MIKFGVTKTSEKESADELSVVVRKGFHIYIYNSVFIKIYICYFQGTMGCTPNSVPMVFIVFPRDSWE